MSFMEPEITQRDRHWEVETTSGTWYVPGHVVPVPDWVLSGGTILEPWLSAFEDELRDYIEPDWDRVKALHVVVGYCGRMQAPGYLDSTEWMFAHTKRTIRQQLDDMFGD
jgi:hypothetical protein